MTTALPTLNGKHVLVTGGNSGIGAGIAKGLAEAGGRVTVLGRNAKRNDAIVTQLNNAYPLCDAQAVAIDLARLDEIEPAFDAITKSRGLVDVLVNNAGTTERARADQLTRDQWDRVLCINLTAPFVLAQSFAKRHIEADTPGSLIFTASLMTKASRPTTAAYTASKGAIGQLIMALAVDWAPFQIRVNGIGPGYIHTPLTQPLVDDAQFSDWVQRRTPLGRWGQPADLAGAAVFLASQQSAFITGQTIYVDGGWLATF